MIAVVILFGVGAAVAVNGARRHNQTATASPSPRPSIEASPSPSASPAASPSPTPAESPSPTASATPSSQPTPTPIPTTTPSTAPTVPAGGGGAGSNCSTTGSGGSGSPREISAGAQYQYCGPAALVVHATDSRDSGATACAGINESTQSFPDGYDGVFFVGVQFPDGQIISAGYIRNSAGREDFGSIQNGSGSQKAGTLGRDPGAGSHTYCVAHVASGWEMRRDSTVIYSTSAEPATDVRGTVLKFDSDVQTVGRPGAANFTFTIPGFHDILVGGSPPSQLRGAAFYS